MQNSPQIVDIIIASKQAIDWKTDKISDHTLFNQVFGMVREAKQSIPLLGQADLNSLRQVIEHSVEAANNRVISTVRQLERSAGVRTVDDEMRVLRSPRVVALNQELERIEQSAARVLEQIVLHDTDRFGLQRKSGPAGWPSIFYPEGGPKA